MMEFVDTFAFIAWLNARDAEHVRVKLYLDGFRGKLITTEWVLVELADALSIPPGRELIARFLPLLRNDSLFEVVPYSDDVYRAGFKLFAERNDKSWSLTDCISFGVMSGRGLTDDLTADHHFEQAGFRAVFKKI